METEKKERLALKEQSIHTSVFLKWIWHQYWPCLLLDEAFVNEDHALIHVIRTLCQRRAGLVINSGCHFDWRTLWCQSLKENGALGQAVNSSISGAGCQFKPIKLVWHIFSAFLPLRKLCKVWYPHLADIFETTEGNSRFFLSVFFNCVASNLLQTAHTFLLSDRETATKRAMEKTRWLMTNHHFNCQKSNFYVKSLKRLFYQHLKPTWAKRTAQRLLFLRFLNSPASRIKYWDFPQNTEMFKCMCVIRRWYNIDVSYHTLT